MMMSSSSLSAQPTLLPTEVWSLISDYTTSPAAEHDGYSSGMQKTGLSSLRCTSRALNLLLTSEEYYRARVIDAIKSLDELNDTMHNKRSTSSLLNKPSSSPWPCAESVGGYKNLFRILIDYAPLEGWYTLCDGWPWGFLVLMKFCDGLFCGEVISVSQEDNNGPSSPPTCQPKRIFEISFNSSGQAICTVIGKKAETFGVRWKSHNSTTKSSNNSYHKVKKRDVFRSLQLRHEFDDDDVFPCNGGMLFHISDILKNNDESNGSVPTDPFFSNMTEFVDATDNDVLLPTACDIIQTLLEREMPVYKYKQNARRPSYINRMKDHYPNGLLFEYLCGPEGRPLSNRVQTQAKSLNTLHPHPLQHGFYVGKNTQRFHQRHLQNEIVKVRNHHIQYAGDKLNGFSSLFQEDLNVSKTDALLMVLDILHPNHLESISESEDFTFVSGRKVTGDIHVPSGETSWIAITSTLEEVTGFPTPPTAILQDSQYHQVTNSWPGWKQLARPFFTDSIWKKGWLLELRGTKNAEVDEWGEGWKYEIEAHYVFWLPEERNYFILSKLSCHFGSYLWDT